jgi:hypothetical protein
MRVMVDYAYGCSRPEDCRPRIVRQYVASVGAGAILKHIAEVGSVRQGDPIAYVVSVFQYGTMT